MMAYSLENTPNVATYLDNCGTCYPRFLGITKRSCPEAHRSYTWSTESKIDLSMALEGPSFFLFAIFVLSRSSNIHHHRLGLASEKTLDP
jgi:hypothetical protein